MLIKIAVGVLLLAGIALCQGIVGITNLVIGLRQDGDEFLFADCAVTNLSDSFELHELEFLHLNVNVTQVIIDAEPGMHRIGFNTWNRVDISASHNETTQLHARINVFGFPNEIEPNARTIVDQKTYHVINSGNYPGQSKVAYDLS